MGTKTVNPTYTRIARTTGPIRIDIRRMIYIDGVCIGKADLQHGVIEVKDRDRRRSSLRGGDIVRVPIRDLAAAFGFTVTEAAA